MSPLLEITADAGVRSRDTTLATRVRNYWNDHVHDANVSTSAPGSPRFFQELEAYRAEKLAYLANVIDFTRFAGRDALEIGCGIGLDQVRLARAGVRTVGVDVSATAIRLAARRLDQGRASAALFVADGGALPFASESFDFVYSHGVLPYVADPAAVIRETYRVLRRGGEALFMAYHTRSWLNLMRRLGRVSLAHSDAPVLRIETRAAFRQSLAVFESCTIVTERFPVPTRIHGGWKAAAFNRFFIPMTNVVPRAVVRPFGWHLLAFCRKAD